MNLFVKLRFRTLINAFRQPERLVYSQSFVKCLIFVELKAVTKNIMSWFLLVVLFISTSGFSVFSHVCSMSGLKEVGISEVESCCSQKEEGTKNKLDQFSSDCCKTDIQFVKFNFDALRGKNEKNIIEQPSSIIYIEQLIELNYNEYISYNVSQNLPPPKTGRIILLQQDLLRI
ncbi:MAG: hypothetical protein H7Y00_11700 [Fimbriimonadaceae bacterium]|nr:hypothetical protein [Chitinophagales bacterium]